MIKDKESWIYEGKEVLSLKDMPKGVIGFVYRIDCVDDNRYYIGRKTVASQKRKKLTIKEKLLPENNRKTFKVEYCESSGWKNYYGSNLILKEEVKKGLKVRRTILKYCFSKADLTFSETSEIICGGALLDPLSFNSWIKATIYKQHLLKNNLK